MTRDKFESTISLLKGSLDYESFRDVDMVIEAVTANVLLKQQTFADLEKYCPPHCILASTTSTFDLNLIGQRTKSSDRIVGAHFLSPADVIPLLEIASTEKTSLQVIFDLIDVGQKIGKPPVVVGNGPGFSGNRMFLQYTQAAILLAERGADIYQIDQAITKFGMSVGLFRLCDLVGLDVKLKSSIQYFEYFPERDYKSMLLSLMIAGMRDGEATGKAFYAYNDKREASPDPELSTISDKEITEMILFPVVNEACRVNAEALAVKTADLDIAGVMAMGFPAYRLSGEESCSGLILTDPNTFVQDWRSGQMSTRHSLIHASTSLVEKAANGCSFEFDSGLREGPVISFEFLFFIVLSRLGISHVLPLLSNQHISLRYKCQLQARELEKS